MRLEYYIYVLNYLDVSRRASTEDIAKSLGFSVSQIARVFKKLKKYNLIETKTGKGGGVVLIKPFHRLIVKDIIPLIDNHHLIYRSFANELQDDPLTELLKGGLALPKKPNTLSFFS